MPKLFRVLLFSVGAIVLFHGTRTVGAMSPDHECVRSVSTGIEDDCPFCCKNTSPNTITTGVDDPSAGVMSFYFAPYDCGGVSDPEIGRAHV